MQGQLGTESTLETVLMQRFLEHDLAVKLASDTVQSQHRFAAVTYNTAMVALRHICEWTPSAWAECHVSSYFYFRV